LLYDNEENLLLFCEAKDFSNKELWSKDTHPEVTSQLNRYNQLISDNKKDILDQYAIHFAVLNKLFGSDLKPPKKVCERCGLLIFGFDSDQKEKIDRLLIKDGSLDEHKHYKIGNIKKDSMKSLDTFFSAIRG